jgi:hypothetical protein
LEPKIIQEDKEEVEQLEKLLDQVFGSQPQPALERIDYRVSKILYSEHM